MAEIAAAGAIAAGVTAVAAGILLALFFVTGTEAWGRANDVASAAFAVMLMPAAVVLGGRLVDDVGAVSWIIAALGLSSMLVAAVASVLTALGRLTVAQLTTWQGGAFGGLFAWVGAASLAMLASGEFAPGLAWLGIIAVGFALAATIDIVRLVRRPGGMAQFETMRRPPMLAAISALLALAAFPAWCVWLGLSL